jgi:predicted MPP superfamily phosphohydrolase
MLPERRARDYGVLRHLIEVGMAAFSGQGWMASLSQRCGLQGGLELIERRYQIAQPDPSPPPLRIAFASDFHAGPTTHPATLERAYRMLCELQPDLLLLGGDFISLQPHAIEALAHALGRVPAPLGRYAVLGNHDLWADERPIIAALEAHGIRVLINQHAVLPAPYQQIAICGLDEPSIGAPDAHAMFRGAPPLRLVLMHSPEGIEQIADHRFDLAFCGHTHGGQICWANGRPIWRLGGKYSPRYLAGSFQLAGQPPRHLIVSRGIGCVGLPIRINACGDIQLCHLSWRK